MKLRATCLAIVLALGCVHSAQAQPKEREAGTVDPATRDKSRAAFRKGVTQLRAQDYNGARASFEEAYALVQHPSILLNLGIAHLKTGDPVLAETDLLRFLQEDGGASPEELASARETLVEAKKLIGTLKVVATPPIAKVTVDGAPLTLKDGAVDVRLKAGSHSVTVEAEGFAPVDRTVDIQAKSEAKLEANLTPRGTTTPPPNGGDKVKDPPKDESSMRPIAGYGLAGVSGVALVVTTVLGLKALSASSDYADKSSPSTYRKAETKDSGIAARTGADVALVVALLAGAGAVILLFTDVGASHEPSTTAPPKGAPQQSWYGPALRSGSPALIPLVAGQRQALSSTVRGLETPNAPSAPLQT